MEPNQSTQAARATFSRAIALHLAGDLEQAGRLYRDVLTADAANAHALHSLGLIARARSEREQALSLLRQAVALEPSEPVFRHSLAQMLRDEGALQQAAAELELAAGLNPRFCGAWDALADVQGQLGHAEREAQARARAAELRTSISDEQFCNGVALVGAGRMQLASEAFRASIAANPHRADAHVELARTLDALGNHEEAQLNLREAARLSRMCAAEESGALSLPLSVAQGAHSGGLHATGEPAPCARDLVRRAFEAFQAGKTQRTVRLCEQALELEPDNRDALHFLGLHALQNESIVEAVDFLRQAVTTGPENAAAHYHLATALLARRRLVDALASCSRATALRPTYAAALHLRGAVLDQLGRFQEAVEAFESALRINPNSAETLLGLSEALLELGQWSRAWEYCQQALQVNPQLAQAFHIRSRIEAAQGRDTEALQTCRQALERLGDDRDARFKTGLQMLRLGCLAEGWALYELRRQLFPKLAQLPGSVPRWEGESLEGCSFLVVAEQGYGDQIQFCRYVRLLRARGAAHITLVCDRRLQLLLSSLPDVDLVCTVNARPWRSRPYDYCAHLLSLPLLCGTTLETIPCQTPYLSAPLSRKQHWAPRLPEGVLRVGLVWKGNPQHENDLFRSVSTLATLAPLWQSRREDVGFISLQTGAGGGEALQAPPDQPLLHLGSELEDFADTAAVIELLDLVICVDTAVAHLAGALGMPCWVLLTTRDTEWRWLNRRADSPWYPHTMRLFRQQLAGDWSSVIAEVARELARLPRRVSV